MKFRKYVTKTIQGTLPDYGTEYWTDKDWDSHNAYVDRLKKSGEFLRPVEITMYVQHHEMFDVQEQEFDTGMYIKQPYPTKDDLDMARNENPGCAVYGGYGVINLMKIQ